MKDYYKTLGIRATASPEDIHARWIELMRKFHPDRGKKGGAQHERIKEINEAYEVLKHSSARGHYDLQRTYYQKKRTLHLQRFILPPIILLVLLFLGLIYFQRSNVTPSPESTLASVRRLISIKASAPNEINQIDEINESNQTNQTNPRNQPTPTRSGAKAKTSVKVYKPVPSRSRSKSRGLTTKINETNQTNEMDEISESNQTNPTSVPKDRRASSLFAKAKKPLKVQKPSPSPSQFNEINQINQIDQINQTNGTTESTEQPNQPNNRTNGTNQINHLSQLTRPPLLAREEEVKHFLDLYRGRYNRKDIDALLSLFSPRVVQNGRDGFDEIKKIYSDFFNQSQKLRYHMKDVKIEIFQNAVEVRGRYEIDQTPKKRGKKKVWRGEIRWILIKENRALKIRFLDFKPQESR